MKNMLIYGLQRSGTNYLESLMKANFDVEFKIDHYTYSLPIHKHFRPYSKPWFFPHLNLLHDFHYDSFDEFDAHCQRLLGIEDLRYVVVSKEPYSWYLSFNRFARREKIFYFMKKKYLNHLYMIDYTNFFKQWLKFKDERPEKIMLVRYESLLTDFENTMTGLKDHWDLEQISDSLQNLQKVNMSKNFNEEKRQAYIEGKFYEKFSDKELRVLTGHLDPEVMERLGYQMHYPKG